jgi:hypothetical protein
LPKNDPTNTGGLFIGRRPGTAPLRYRETPVTGSASRRRFDSALAGAILVLETVILSTLWGPQPAGWLWVGSQIYHETDSVGMGILVAFAGMLCTILITLSIAMRLDRAWKLVRRAAGKEQKEGMLERIFVVSMALTGAAFLFWFIVIQGPGADLAPRS